MSLARNTLVQSSLTLGSRILGFARDLALAGRFGQGPLMDVFATALMLPNLFRRLFAEGAFAQAFVPVYGGTRESEGAEVADRMASEALSFMLLVVATVTVGLQIAMPWLMPLLLSAYVDEPEVMALGVLATQLAMPYLACMTLVALLSGVLNTAGRFALSAGAPVLLNLFTLAALAVPALPPDLALIATTAAVAASGLAQVGLLWWGVRRQGLKVRLVAPWPTARVRQVLWLAIPGALAGSALQLSSLVSQVLTGSDPGARSVLYNADRLYQLPLGLVGVAIGLALVPRLTRAFVAEDTAGGERTLSDGVALAMALTLPAATALFAMPYLLIDAALTRGAFTSADAARTAEALRQFAWGVPAFVLAKVLTPPFFARRDTRRPMVFALIAVAVNVALGIGLYLGLTRAGQDGVVGLAIATSASGWVNVALLAATLAVERTWRPGRALVSRLMRVALASGLMGAGLWAAELNYGLLNVLFWRKEVTVLVVCAAGALAYGGLVMALRATSLAELRSALRRDAGGSGPAAPPGLDG